MRHVMFGILCFILPHAYADDVTPVPKLAGSSSTGYSSPAAALAALRAKPGVKIREENGWIVVNDPSENAFWSITTPQLAPHPAAVKRRLVEKDGAIRMEMTVQCGAPKPICDRMVQVFQETDRNLTRPPSGTQ